MRGFCGLFSPVCPWRTALTVPAGKTLHGTEVLRSESLALGRSVLDRGSRRAGDMDWRAFALYGCVVEQGFPELPPVPRPRATTA
jgi:hypothetical protein